MSSLPGEMRRDAARMSAAPCRLGLTATPVRSDGRDVDLDWLIGPRVYDLPIAAVRGKTLPAYSWQDLCAETGKDPAARQALRAYRQTQAIEDRAEDKLRVLEDIFRRHVGSPVVIFAGSNVMARAVSRRFLIPCLLNHCRKKERLDLLTGLQDGTYPALVANQVLDEGVDLPAVKIAVVIGGMASTKQTKQRLGRILGKSGKARATLYEVVCADTKEEERSRQRRGSDAYIGTRHRRIDARGRDHKRFMLTREMAIADYRDGRIIPDRLTRSDHAHYLEYAERMLRVYRSGVGRTRADLHRDVHHLFAAEFDCPTRRIDAFCKLLDDASEFEQDRRGARRHCDESCFAKTVWVSDDFRTILRYAKLARLMHTIQCLGRPANPVSEAMGEFRTAVTAGEGFSGARTNRERYAMHFDGPASVLRETRRYGIAMARFLPALIACRGWRLHAVVKTARRGGTVALDLSPADRLNSHLPPPTEFDSDVEAAFADK